MKIKYFYVILYKGKINYKLVLIDGPLSVPLTFQQSVRRAFWMENSIGLENNRLRFYRIWSTEQA